MGRTAAATARLESILFRSFQYLAKKRARKEYDVPGSSTPVSASITAIVDGSRITMDLDGNLLVGMPSKGAKPSAAAAADVTAWMLDQFDEATRDRILATLPQQFEKLGALPQVPKLRLTQAEELLTRLRGSKITSRKGAVVFKLAGEEDDEEEADDGDEQD